MGLNETAKKILGKRYVARDEDNNAIEEPEDVFERVAKTIAEADRKYGGDVSKTEKTFLKMMENLDFLPNSPTLMNAGRPLGQLSACFVLPIEDSMDGIYDSIKHAALIHKSGGGTGFSFSRLRGTGSVVRTTGGVASGPISFMRVFNASTEAVKQGGTRRGANMAILRVDHPDILDFISCKQDNKDITNFNISVGVTEDFMKAVNNNSEYNLIDPRTKKVVGILNAKEVFEKIVDNSWNNGEPGIVFLDRMNKDNPVPSQGEIESTNPCVIGNTLILTENGYVKIKEVENEYVKVWNGEEFSTVQVKKTGENQEIMYIEFSDGSYLKCTPYHKFYVSEGYGQDSIRVEAKDLMVGTKLEKFKFPVIDTGDNANEKIMYTAGFFSGDGSYNTLRDKNDIWLYGEKQKLVDKLEYEYINKFKDGELTQVRLNNNSIYDKKFVPSTKYSIKSRLEWLAGIIDSDGTRASKEWGGVSITSVDEIFVYNIKMMLNTLGCSSTLALSHEATAKMMPDGSGGTKEYNCKECYRLSISAYNIMKLVQMGLTTYRVDTSHKCSREASRHLVVTNISKSVNEDTFCFTETLRHKGLFNSVLTGNCGEQPLLPYESCNLGSINLLNMVKKRKLKALTFSGYKIEYEIDYLKLDSTVDNAVHFLDNVIDANQYPLKQIEEQTLSTRKIGLGIMGLADLLILLGISYGSEEGIKQGEIIMDRIQRRAKQASIELAKTRGAFPTFSDSIYKDEEPIRNATRTTIAPTGTISMIAQASSGIEPLFAVAFVKTVMDNQSFKELNSALYNYLKTNNLDSEEMMNEITAHGTIAGTDLDEEVKHIFVTAHDISPIWHIRMQAAMQKHTDNAVSKTVNFSHGATKDEVREVYMLAYELGCKGVTIYRDGSRDEQVLSTGIGNEKAKEKDEVACTESSNTECSSCTKCGHDVEKEAVLPRERPIETSGITRKINIGCGKLYVTVNYDAEGISEIFTHNGKGGGCPSQSEATARLASLALRVGVPTETVINELKGIRCPSTISRNLDNGGTKVLSCPDAIARVMERVKQNEQRAISVNNIDIKEIPENKKLSASKAIENNKCSECGSTLEHEGGCVICRNCGYSKCG